MTTTTITDFKQQTATPLENKILQLTMDTFSDNRAYETPKTIDKLFDNDHYIDIFTTSGILVTSVNLTKSQFIHTPIETLCLLTRNLDTFIHTILENEVKEQ